MAQAEATVDQRAAVILTFHAALEREIDVVLAALLPRPDKLKKGFGFANKIDVWRPHGGAIQTPGTECISCYGGSTTYAIRSPTGTQSRKSSAG